MRQNERILIALTTVQWVVLTLLAMNLGCGSSVIHLRSAETGAFAQLLHDEMSGDARRPAHGMQTFVSGKSQDLRILDALKLPEGYTFYGEQGVYKYQYHLAYAAQRLLRTYYAAAFPKSGLEWDQLIAIVDAAGGDANKLEVYDRDQPVDIADLRRRYLFEIVPPGPAHQTAGKKKADAQLAVLNSALGGAPKFQLGAEFSGEIGVRFAERAPPWILSWDTNNGVIQYEWRALTVDKFNEDACLTAYLDNRWHVPSAEEMARYARPLHEVVERLDRPQQFVYEIKARGDVHLAKGKEKLARYIAALNLGMAGTSKVFVPGPDYKGELVLQFKRGKGCWYLEWSTTAPGLLQYTIRQLHPVRDKDGVATMNECAKAQKEGKWTDLSDKEASDDARAFFEDVEGMVRRREKLAQVRDATTVPIEAIGTLAELILSAGLSLQMNTAPQVGIGLSNEVPFGPSPKPLPPVNARSLGSDTRMVPRNQRPGTTGKTPNTVTPN